MKIDVKVPSVGESVREAVLAKWYRQDGDQVRKDELLFLIETDKVTLEITAEASGVLKTLVHEGETVAIGAVVGTIDSEAAPAEAKPQAPPAPPPPRQPVQPSAQPVPQVEQRAETPREREAPELGLAPSVRRLAEETGVDISQVAGTGPGGRITRGDILLHTEESRLPEKRAREVPAPTAAPERDTSRVPEPPSVQPPPVQPREPAPTEPTQERAEAYEEHTTRKPMSRIRKRIAERLLEAKQGTAMLTTFNEIDMSRVKAIRARFKEPFREKYGVSLGLMSFFVKASIAALKDIPEINAFIDGNDIIYHDYYHIGVAVGSERGLVVPVIRHADRMSFAEIEKAILDSVKKIRDNRLEVSDLEGGTFTISNGGIYGSLLSTPILNMPQSGILGMHKIEDRPVAIGGQVVIRPMMYVALSYDHRIVDGREAVTFLKRIKECIEYPERMMMEV